MQTLSRWDHRLFQAITNVPRVALIDGIMILFSMIGIGGSIWFGLAGLVVWATSPSGLRNSLIIVLALLATIVINDLLLKPLRMRPRPFDTETIAVVGGRRPSSYSFPSGHAALSAAGAVTMGYTLPAFAPVWWLLALMIGFSRIHLGVHYPSDVVVGFILGSLLGIVAIVWVEYV
jgi:undecaprenyl-diphosphatase